MPAGSPSIVLYWPQTSYVYVGGGNGTALAARLRRSSRGTRASRSPGPWATAPARSARRRSTSASSPEAARRGERVRRPLRRGGAAPLVASRAAGLAPGSRPGYTHGDPGGVQDERRQGPSGRVGRGPSGWPAPVREAGRVLGAAPRSSAQPHERLPEAARRRPGLHRGRPRLQLSVALRRHPDVAWQTIGDEAVVMSPRRGPRPRPQPRGRPRVVPGRGAGRGRPRGGRGRALRHGGGGGPRGRARRSWRSCASAGLVVEA